MPTRFGKPCRACFNESSNITARHALMASTIFFDASSTVSPCDMHPGISKHSATIRPSSPFLRATFRITPGIFSVFFIVVAPSRKRVDYMLLLFVAISTARSGDDCVGIIPNSIIYPQTSRLSIAHSVGDSQETYEQCPSLVSVVPKNAKNAQRGRNRRGIIPLLIGAHGPFGVAMPWRSSLRKSFAMRSCKKCVRKCPRRCALFPSRADSPAAAGFAALFKGKFLGRHGSDHSAGGCVACSKLASRLALQRQYSVSRTLPQGPSASVRC